MGDVNIDLVTHAVARVKSAGYEFQWFRPFARGKPVLTVGSASIVDIPVSLVPESKKVEWKNSVFLITAYHVASESQRLWSTFGSVTRRRFETHLVGACPDIDVALLRVDNIPEQERKQLAALKWGNSDSIHINQTVFAAGFPHGQTSVKMARGIISGREQGSIQFDASVNGGNSGGPLLESKTTNIIGVVTSSERNAQSMNYATPIDQVLVRLPRLLAGGMDALPSFNMRTNIASPALLKLLESPEEGAYVRFVQKDTPLYVEGGLREGDVLLAIRTNKDGWMRVAVDGDVRVPWWTAPVTQNTIQHRLLLGETISIRYWSTKEKKIVEKKVVLTMPDAMAIREYDPRYETPDYETFGGAVIMQLAVNHMTQRGAEKGTNWIERFAYLKQQIEKRTEPILVVTHILPSSSLTATVSTMGAGDVITHVNGERVKTLQEYRNALKKSEQGKDSFIVWRTEDGMTTVVDYNVAKKEYERWKNDETK